MNVVEISAKQLSHAIKEKKISAVEATQAYIDQVIRINPKINAIVQFRPEQALVDARKLDIMQSKGKSLGPLHGIPFTLKDVYNIKGDVVTAGCFGLKDHIADNNATLFTRLISAGAIFLGKTNTPELECAVETDNLVYGKTCNPYNFNYSSGGSTGGGAALVSACGSAFDIGSDLGGSLRIPAHYCGITTIRSSVRRVPSSGVVFGFRTGIAGMFVAEGPLCRYIEDLELVMSVIHGPDNIDPNVIPLPWFKSGRLNSSVHKLKIAYFDNDGNSLVTNETKETIKNVTRVLADLGCEVENDYPHCIGDGFEIFKEVLGGNIINSYQETLKYLKVTEPSSLMQKLFKLISPYTCDLPTFMSRWDKWEMFRSEVLKFFQQYDILISPVTAREALPLTATMYDDSLFPNVSYAWNISSTLLPSVVVCAGMTQSGLPIGIQIVSKPFREDMALSIAHKIEYALGGWKKSKLI